MEVNYEEEGDPSSKDKQHDDKINFIQEDQSKNDDNISTTEDVSTKKDHSEEKYQRNEENVQLTKNKKKSKGVKRLDGNKGDKGEKKLNQQSSIIQFNEVISKNHFKVIIENTDVYFPYEPYPVQSEYTKKVIESCQSKSNSLLEGPSGTGKTLSLLLGSLSWLSYERKSNENNNQEKSCKIIYCSSSMNLINQAVKELKKCALEPKISILGSRDCLCSNSKVNKFRGSTLISKCKQLRGGNNDENSCIYFRNTTDKNNPVKMEWQVQDIEDLHDMAKSKNICPYYYQKLTMSEADIIFITYDYLLDQKQLSAFNLSLENSVIIFDEAHNIEKRCEEISSFEISISQLRDSIQELSQLEKRINNSNEEQKKKFTASIEDVENSKMLTQNFKDYIKAFDMNSSDKIAHKNIKEGVAMFAGNKVFNLMFKASEHGYNGTEYQGINNKNFHFWLTTFENVLADIADEFNPEIFSAFEYWFKCIKTMINMYKMNNKQTAELNFKNPIDAVGARDIDHYYLSISQEKLPYNEIKNLSKEEIFSKITETRKICFWCFNPSLCFKRIIEHSPRNIILASYALSPFLSYETELKTRFAIQHESNHIIEKDQVNVTILKKAIKGRTFNFSYKERDCKDIAKDLGYTIIEICKVTPGGIVIVFQSSGFMRQITTLWDTYGISRSISQIKQIFIEPKENQNVKFALPEYYKAALNSGGMLIVSSTGIVVEGLDLSDDAARTIVQIGIPFPNLGDPKTIMKKEYLDKLKLIKKDHNALNGQKWYLLQAARDVNHLIGKIATHKHDYGNIILLDDRYCNSQQRNQFTHWLKHNIKIEDDILKCKKNFKQFFQNMKEKNLIPKIKRFDQIRLNYSHMDQNEYLFELSEIVKKAAEAYDLKFGYLKTPKVNFKSEDPKIKIEKVEAKSKQKQEKSKSKTLSQKSKSSSKCSRKNSKSSQCSDNLFSGKKRKRSQDPKEVSQKLKSSNPNSLKLKEKELNKEVNPEEAEELDKEILAMKLSNSEYKTFEQFLSNDDFESLKTLLRQIKKFDDCDAQIQKVIELVFGENNGEKARRHREFKEKHRALEEAILTVNGHNKIKKFQEKLEMFVCPHKFRQNNSEEESIGNKSESEELPSIDSECENDDRQRRAIDSEDEEEAQYGCGVIVQPKEDEELIKEREERRRKREEEQLKKRQQIDDYIEHDPEKLTTNKSFKREMERIKSELNPIERLQLDESDYKPRSKNLRAEFSSVVNPLIFLDKEEIDYMEHMEKTNKPIDYIEAQAQNKEKRMNKKKKRKNKKRKKGGEESSQEQPEEEEIQTKRKNKVEYYSPPTDFDIGVGMLNQCFKQHLGRNKKYEMHKIACERSGTNNLFDMD